MTHQAITSPGSPPGILVANHFVQNYGYSVRRPFGRRDWLLFYTVNGTGQFRVGGHMYVTKPREIVLLLPDTPQDYASANADEAWDFYWVHFLPRPYWTQWLQLPEREPGLVTLQLSDMAISGRLEHAFQRLVADNNNFSTLQEELALNALEEILILVAQQNLRVAAQPIEMDHRVQRVLELLNQNVTASLSVAELAHMVSLSPSRLAHLFKTQVGDSIQATHLKNRLRLATRLLEFTDQSISEIALSLGYPSYAHFSHHFKNYYGTSPQFYRKKMHQPDQNLFSYYKAHKP